MKFSQFDVFINAFTPSHLNGVSSRFFLNHINKYNCLMSSNTFRQILLYETYSVGRCVIPCAFFGKSAKHTFSCRKMYSV